MNNHPRQRGLLLLNWDRREFDFIATLMFVLGLIAYAPALAEETPLAFEEGKLFLVDHSVEVRFGEETFRLENLRVLNRRKDDVERPAKNDEKPKRTAIRFKSEVIGDVEPDTNPLFYVNEEPRTDANPVSFVTIGRYQLDRDRYLFVWALNRESVALSRTYQMRAIFLHEVVKRTEGWNFVEKSVVVASRFPDVDHRFRFHINSIALTPRGPLLPEGANHPSSFLMFAYDEAGPGVLPFRVNLPAIGVQAGIEGLANPSEIGLPEEFATGRELSVGGQLAYDSHRKVLWIRPHVTEDGTPPAMEIPIDGKSTRSLGNTDGPIKDYKLASRVRWVRSLQSVEELLTATGRVPGSVTLSAVTSPWLNAVEASADSADADVPGDSEFLMLGVPRLLMAYRPDLAQEAALVALEEMKAHFQHQEATHFFYLALPSTSFSVNTIRTNVHQEVLSRSMLPGGRNQFLLLDARALDRDDAVFFPEVLDAIHLALASIAGVKLHVLAIGNTDFLEFAQARVDKGLLKIRSCRTKLLNGEFSRSEILKFLRRYLNDRYSIQVPTPPLSQIVSAMESDLGLVTAPLSLIDLFAPRLGRLLSKPGADFRTAEGIKKIVEAYLRIAGDRTPRQFSPETIQQVRSLVRLLSTNSPYHLPDALFGIDHILVEVEQRLLAWMQYQTKQGVPILPFVFIGASGTGKSMLGTGLAKVFSRVAAVRSLNAGDFAPKKESDEGNRHRGESPEDTMREVIEANVEDLLLDPRDAKFLIIDELNLNPMMVRPLIPALGDSDAHRPGVLDLRGTIPIIMLNLNLGTTPYAKLLQTEYGGPGWRSALCDVFVDSLSTLLKAITGPAPLDEKSAGALASRLLKGMFFFPPSSQKGEQLGGYAEGLIGKYEEKHNMRVLLTAEIKSKLIERLMDSGTGNYRTGDDSIEEVISQAITNSTGGAGPTDGENYILRRMTHRPAVTWELVPAVGEFGIRLIAEKNYRTLMDGVRNTLEYHVLMAEEEASLGRPVDEEKIHGYRVMAEAVGIASRKPLFIDDGTGDNSPLAVDLGIPIEFPKEAKAEVKLNLERNLTTLMSHLFSAYDKNPGFGTTQTRNDDPSALPKEINQILETATLVFRGVANLKQLMRLNGDRGYLTPAWMEKHVDAYVNGRLGQEEEHLRKAELEFMDAQLTAWGSLERTLEGEIKERVRRQKIVEFGEALSKALEALVKKHGRLKDKPTLESFLEKLKEGELEDAKGIKDRVKQRDEISLETVSSPTESPRGKSKEGILDLDWKWATSGFVLDHLVRKVAERWMEKRRAQQIANNFLETHANGVACKDILSQAFRKTDAKAENLFKPHEIFFGEEVDEASTPISSPAAQ
jgi:hypothetical protein